MATTGSWMLPSLGGDVYLKKPPLLFWSTATAIEVLGFSMLAAPVFASRRARVYLALRGGASP